MPPKAAAATGPAESVAQLCAAVGDLRLRMTLSRLDWAARLPNRAAPGFVYLAGARGGWPVGGGGRDLAEAAGRLAGETAEVLAMTAPAPASVAPGDPAIEAVWAGPDRARIAARNLTLRRPVSVPAPALLAGTRPPGTPPASLGVAAGSDRERAALSGLLELVERDAAAAWWLDGARPRLLDQASAAPAAVELARLRAGASRATAFLALASPTDVPVICAVSRDPDGRGLAIGLKAAPDAGAAATGAMLELLQMEIALELARLRQAQHRPAEGDRATLERAALDTDRIAAFAPGLPAPAGAPVPADLDGLVRHLAARGLEVTVADLSAPEGGLAVAKAFAPGLRPMPGDARARPESPGARAALMG